MDIPLVKSTDAQLVRAVRGGNTAAFDQLVSRYQGLAYGLAYHQIGSFADAQDAAQEAFVKAFRSIDSLQQPERFAAWLKAIVTNECRMALRGSRRTVFLEEAEMSACDLSLAEQDWGRRERQEDIRRAVDCLPEKSRLTVNLHYLSGLSHREIGEFLGIPANAVAQHLHRARRQLRQILLADIEEDYNMNRLPESFTQDVRARLALYPIKDGYFLTADGEGDTRGITMAVGEEPEKAYITLWMRAEDLNDILLGTLPARTAEMAKGRALDSELRVLEAFGIGLEHVALRLTDSRRCRAAAEFVQGDNRMWVDLRPSDAIGLAVRTKAAISAEDAIVRRGNVGEDGVYVPDQDIDVALHNAEYERIRKADAITDRAFEMVSTEDWTDTVRFRRDEAKGVLRMWLEADPGEEVAFDLAEYDSGANMVFDLARRRGSCGKLKGDQVSGWTDRYRLLFSMLGDDARMRVIRENADPQATD
jgi:RNA polymerase sigma-70 factor (ECF subfamily)